MAELLTPATDSVFLATLLPATLETLAMSVVGTLLAAGFDGHLAKPLSVDALVDAVEAASRLRAAW